jgi:pyruvate/2-oxoglutarate dehydrogenase complex dihydrolipoamide dehydrogenase (E3) component
VGQSGYANKSRAMVFGKTHGLTKFVAEGSCGHILAGNKVGSETMGLILDMITAMVAGNNVSDIGNTLYSYQHFLEEYEMPGRQQCNSHHKWE